MPWNNEIPPLLQPPASEDPNLDRIDTGNEELDAALWALYDQLKANADRSSKALSDLRDFGGALAAAFERYGSSVNRVVNGGIEFPTPYATDHTGNLKISYVDVVTHGTGGGNWMAIPHNYGDGTQGQAPRGWFQMANSLATSSGRFLDQLVSSTLPAPFSGTGYTTATITAATTITGAPGATVQGWTYQGVQAGDQFRAFRSVAGTGTIQPGAGATTITGTGTLFTTEAKVGWLVRMTPVGANDKTWHRIESIASNTSMVVAPAFVQAEGAGRAIEFLQFDRTWCDISAINSGTPDTLTLASPGSEVPAGATLCDYVIRRPADSTYIYVRFVGSGITETTLAVF